MIEPNMKESATAKIMINVGCLFDVPTGYILTGAHGESILNGGLGMLTAITGIGNSFKSTLLYYQMLAAASRVFPAKETYLMTYDTEINIHEERLKRFTQTFAPFKERDIISEGWWKLTDKTVYYGNEWYEIFRTYLQEKLKTPQKEYLVTPFLDRDKKSFIATLPPTFSAIDSFTEFDTEDVVRVQDENELGEAGGNTIFMRQGLAKARLLMELPTLCGKAQNYFLMTAHLGKDMQIASGPYAAPPTKKLQQLRAGDKVKGVTDRFFFLLNNFWQVYNSSPLLNDNTKGPEYPLRSDDPQPGSLDLNVVTVKLLRSKSGPSGTTFDVVISQTEGVLPSLTEFHYIKSQKRYGLEGNLQNYHLCLYPELNLTRPTIRSKIDQDAKLRRALNITAELCQMSQLWFSHAHLLCDPKTLYEDLKKQGYDWDMLLRTRGYWCYNNDEVAPVYLSTMDLLRMRLGLYHPYWLEEDKKTLKPGFSLASS